MGPPTKFNQDTADRILSALRAGNTLRASAKYVGVSEDALYVWRKKKPDFSAQVDQAEAECEVRCVAQIAKSINEGNTADAWKWLERRRHEDWRERKEIQHTGKDGESLTALSDDDLDAQIAALQSRTRATARATDAATTPATED